MRSNSNLSLILLHGSLLNCADELVASTTSCCPASGIVYYAAILFVRTPRSAMRNALLSHRLIENKSSEDSGLHTYQGPGI
eukprot:scaffold55431_cov41-Tisochrysis_lutea.AAC.1